MDIRSLHTQAMDLAEQAAARRTSGHRDDALNLLRQALEKEQHAAFLAVSETAPEPTRSILLKSAAHLAIDCGEPRQAERLIAQALAGEPPSEMADELRTMFRKLNVKRPRPLNGRRPRHTAIRKPRATAAR
jgi:hypothetical protein